MNCKRWACLLFACVLLLTVSACGKDDNIPPSLSDGALVVEGLDAEGMFDEEDMTASSGTSTSTTTSGGAVTDGSGTDKTTAPTTAVKVPSGAVKVTLKDGGSTATAGVRVNGDVVTIAVAGTYYLQGALSNGRIVVEASAKDKVQLVLCGVQVTCATSAPLYVKQADKVTVTLADGTQNTLANTADFVAVDDNNIDGVVFSKDDLTFNGSGKLTVNAAYGHGIVCKDSLVFTAGTYAVNAADHAVQGKDDVRIAAGNFTLNAKKDGIHVENSEDTSLGYLYIGGGDFSVTADGDGFSASGILQIDGGKGKLLVGGGAKASAGSSSQSPWGGRPNSGYAGTTEDTVSAKGMKATANLLLKGGEWSIDAADDGIHSNASATVTAGVYTVASGDDGVHADAVLLISGGTITVTQSYEGLEGTSVDITGGTVRVTASDDGINAAGGADQSGFGGGMQRPDEFSNDGSRYIRISGGKLTVNAAGDGLDANGNVYVTGGETYVSGPTSSGNGALDYDGTAEISGGIFIAVGSSGMAQGFSSASGQGAILTSLSGIAGEALTLKNSAGKTLVSWTPEKAYSSVVISCPGLTNEGTYTLAAGSNSQSITMADWLYGGSGGMGGRPDGGRPQRPGRW